MNLFELWKELLDLGERIGSVSTGLSEEMIAKCLTKTLYDHASDHSDEEGTCIICLVRKHFFYVPSN